MNAERLLAYYEKIADAPDAIMRLRRFILDLAVRGKLVPQDPKDEPATELLKRIANEKARLIETGEIKRQKPVESSGTGHRSIDLPVGWSIACLSEAAVCLDYRRVPINGTERDARIDGKPRESLFPYYGATQQQGWIDEYLFDGEFVLLGEDGVPFHDPLRAKAYLISGKSWVNNHAHVFQPILISPRFLVHYLNVFDYAGRVVGATRAKLNQAHAVTIPIPLPPLAEQHRIVAKVDELMALCDQLEKSRTAREETRDRLTAASLARLNDPAPETFQVDARFALDALPSMTARPDQIKQLRQTILNLAVLGKLVPQDPEHAAAAELLERLQRAQAGAFASEGLRTRQGVKKLQRDDMWFQFPQSWVLSHFDDLFVIASGVTKGQKVATSTAVDVPYLRVANVQRGHLDLTVIKKMTVREIDRERYALKRGDILMTEGGDWDKLGRAAVWREEIPGCIHQNHIFRVRPPSPDILPEWVIAYTNSHLGRAFFEDASKQTTNLASINMTQLRGCPIPLPSLDEQKRIVAKVDELMALCDRLEASLAAGETARSRLLDALLHEALEPSVDRLEAAA